MPLMMREAADDFRAFLTADAMERAGATVISVVNNGRHTPYNRHNPCERFLVFARVSDMNVIDSIDEAIDKALLE